jgi:hypothetical protein
MNLVRDYHRRARECRELAKLSAAVHHDRIIAIAETWEVMAFRREALLNARDEVGKKEES